MCSIGRARPGAKEARGTRQAALPWHGPAMLHGSGQLCRFSWASRPWAVGPLPMRRSYDGRAMLCACASASDRPWRCNRLGGGGTAKSVLAPPHAAGGALVEGGHRLVRRADLKLLVVRVVVAALAAVGCRERGRGRMREPEMCTVAVASKRWWWRGARAHPRSDRRSSTRLVHQARRRPPSARASPPTSLCS